MYLKAIEIYGFKSFPEKTRLTFEKPVTAIVGPNGSGKSNISDAVLWVMGEQSSKALRGGKMEDVIFGGTERRNKQSFAQVTLVLDNESGIFGTDSAQTEITRRCYRSGESEYYINRREVRLRDITELLTDTGLGRCGYSIIGQGRISEIVSSKSTDRRDIFEEAAGIARFRMKKDDAERKLSRTEDNLLRIGDKINELELQLEPLEKQAKTAKKYAILSSELRGLDISARSWELEKQTERAKTIVSDLERTRSDLAVLKKHTEQLFARESELSDKIMENDAHSESLRGDVSETERIRAQSDAKLAALSANLQNCLASCERTSREKAVLSSRAEELSGRIDRYESKLASLASGRDGLRKTEADISNELLENSAAFGEQSLESESLLSEESAASERAAAARATLSVLSETSQELLRQKKDAEKRLEDAGGAYAAEQEKYYAAAAEYDELANKLEENQRASEALRKSAQVLAEEKLALEGEMDKLSRELSTVESRLSILSELEKEYEGFSKAVKTIMQASAGGTLSGVHGTVAQLVFVDREYTLAVETALGRSLQSIVVSTQEDGARAIELLRRRDAGRGTFLPLSAIRGAALANPPDTEPGYIGTAVQLASFDDTYRDVFVNLLGRTAVVDNLSHAVAIAKKFRNRFRIVTLDGQIINAGGSMTGGSAGGGVGVLSRTGELNRLRRRKKELDGKMKFNNDALIEIAEQIASGMAGLEALVESISFQTGEKIRLDGEKKRVEQSLSVAEKSLSDARNLFLELEKRAADSDERRARLTLELEDAGKRLEKIHARTQRHTSGKNELERDREELQSRLSEVKSALAANEAETQAAKELLSRTRELADSSYMEYESLKREADELEAQKQRLENELACEKKNVVLTSERLAQLREGVSAAVAQKLALEKSRTETRKTAQEKNNELISLERLCAALEQNKISAENNEKQLIDQLWESFGIGPSAAMEYRLPPEKASFCRTRIQELKKEISSLGSVNPNAEGEYARVRERYDFLTSQRDDALRAEKELGKIISGITEEMETIFVREFSDISGEFSKIFVSLFGGGAGELSLEEPDDPLNCGISIRVRPPGKTPSSISLLSGGETSLAAIALYFAVLKVKPAPFCVMDEIEAALDETNVERFASYMRKMSERTQFIAITHRRGTMEAADVIYGVTMEEKGVSKVISVDLDTAGREEST